MLEKCHIIIEKIHNLWYHMLVYLCVSVWNLYAVLLLLLFLSFPWKELDLRYYHSLHLILLLIGTFHAGVSS